MLGALRLVSADCGERVCACASPVFACVCVIAADASCYQSLVDIGRTIEFPLKIYISHTDMDAHRLFFKDLSGNMAENGTKSDKKGITEILFDI